MSLLGTLSSYAKSPRSDQWVKKKCSFSRQLSILKFSMIASLRGHKQGKGKPLLFSVCKRGFS